MKRFSVSKIERIAMTGLASIVMVAPLVLNSGESVASANRRPRTSRVSMSERSQVARMTNQVKREDRSVDKIDRAMKHASRKQKKAMRKQVASLNADRSAIDRTLKSIRHEIGKTPMKKMDKMNMSSMMRMHGTRAPKGLKLAKHPKFHKSSRVVIKASHMPGMKGAKGRVVGAYDTKLYAVNYQPTNHGKTVRDHKWVVGAEMRPSTHLRVGKHVILRANHMKFMKGAKAKIVSVHNGPAYMVNYRQTTNHAKVTNHKWLAQNELAK